MNREMTRLYERIAGLPLRIDSVELEPLDSGTYGGWVRHTTVVRFRGAGHAGEGEEVNYQEREQLAFRERAPAMPLAGSWSFERFSRALDAIDLGPEPLYRRWALESAALDLALRQAGTHLAAALGLEARPLAFVASLGLGSPPSVATLMEILKRSPGIGFKVDLGADWTRETVEALRATGAVRTVDLKGRYVGDYTGPPADVDRYRAVAEGLPAAVLEDPAWTPEIAAALAPFRDRIAWDAILHSVADISGLPFKPRCVNMKPSRFGRVSELLAAYAYCDEQGIAMYGGGQFELGPGRRQIQLLASLFHPTGDNDVAPTEYNRRPVPRGLRGSPLDLRPGPLGFSMT